MSTFGVSIRRAILCAAIGAITPSVSASAHADLPTKIPRVGVLLTANSGLEDDLRRGLSELGYVEGQNLLIVRPRSRVGDANLRLLSEDLARSKVQVIVAVGSPQTRAVLQATSLPVVFISGDPIGAGFAATLARPGGNATGLSLVTVELTPSV